MTKYQVDREITIEGEDDEQPADTSRFGSIKFATTLLVFSFIVVCFLLGAILGILERISRSL